MRKKCDMCDKPISEVGMVIRCFMFKNQRTFLCKNCRKKYNIKQSKRIISSIKK